jgi:flagellar basal body-associated protein FliL
MHHLCIFWQYRLGAKKMATAKANEKVRKAHSASRRLVRVTISLDVEDYAAFENLGEKAQLSRSWLIRKAMREYLDRNSDGHIFGKQ